MTPFSEIDWRTFDVNSWCASLGLLLMMNYSCASAVLKSQGPEDWSRGRPPSKGTASAIHTWCGNGAEMVRRMVRRMVREWFGNGEEMVR